MSFIEKFVKQCRNPSGLFGKFVARAMNVGHARMRNWALGHISIGSDAKILDIGCGGGGTVKALAKHTPKGNVCGIDFSADMVQLSMKVNNRLIKKGLVKIKLGAVSSLPFADNIFDLATAFETYYFWPNLIDDLKEIRRVLKPGGTLLIANEVYKDAKFEKRNTKWVNLIDMQLHTPDEYKAFLTQAGYQIVEIDVIAEKNWITAVVKK